MPEQATLDAAHRDLAEGKSASTAAGEFVKQEIDHVREGKHGVKNTKQAIAIGLSEARRAGVDIPDNPNRRSKTGVRKSAKKGAKKSARKSARKSAKTSAKTSVKRARAAKKALKRLPKRGASKKALSRQAKSTARKRGATARSASARKAARTRARTSGKKRR